MQLKKIQIERFRNLTHISLSDLGLVNVFSGQNGSGKSSLLEALYLLGTGRSFRTSQLKQYIQHGTQDAIVYAKLLDHQAVSHDLGIQKLSDGTTTIKLDGQLQPSMATIASLLPIQLIDPIGLSVLEDGSSSRRQLFDWLLFYAEPNFYGLWLNYQRALKHRNKLLKQVKLRLTRFDPAEFTSWEQQLEQFGREIHGLRHKTMQTFKPIFADMLQALLPDIEVELHYLAGFDLSSSLADVLAQHREQDLERGFSFFGVHRSDVKLKTPIGYAEHVLSRGQKKLLILAFKLAQIQMLHSLNCPSVVLLDDVNSELDTQALQRVVEVLSRCNSQLFLTTLQVDSVQKILSDLYDSSTISVFDVNAGIIQKTAS